MVDNNENKKGGFGSFLERAVTLAPVTGATGFATYKSLLEASTSASGATEQPLQKAMKVLNTIERKTNLASDQQKNIAIMNRLSGTIDTPEGLELVKTAWTQAITSADPSIKAALTEVSQQLESIQPGQASSYIDNILKGNTAQGAHRTFRTFFRNLQSLQNQSGVHRYKSVPMVTSKATIKGLSPSPAWSRFEQALGKTTGVFGTTISSLHRPGLGEGSQVFSAETKFGTLRFGLPISRGSVISSGTTQQSMRINNPVLIYDPLTQTSERLSRESYILREIEESVLPDITSGRLRGQHNINRAIKQVKYKALSALESIPAISPERMTPAMQLYATARSKNIDVLIKGERTIREGPWSLSSPFRAPTETELADIMQREGLFGGVSPGAIAGGKLNLADLSQGSLVPESVSWGRRPEQGIRKWGLTESARALLNNTENKRYARYRSYSRNATATVTRNLIGSSGISADRLTALTQTNPFVKVAYIDPKRHSKLLERASMGEGEALGRRGLSDLLEFETTRTARLYQVREDLLQASQGAQLPSLAEGDVLGWTSSGKAFKYRQGMNILGLTQFSDETATSGGYLQVAYSEAKRLRSNDKIFGGIKAVTRLMNEQRIQRISKRILRSKEMAEHIDIIASMDELRKDPSKHVQQIVSSLGEVLNQRPMLATSATQTFANDPSVLTNIWRQRALAGGTYSHTAFIQEAMKWGFEQADLTPTEFGSVFGAVPYVLDKDKGTMADFISSVAPGKGTPDYLAAIMRGGAVGATSITYGGPSSLTGAGSMGTLEPRIQTLLQGGALGDVSPLLQQDIAQRLIATNPNKLLAMESLGKSLGSIAGLSTPGEGERVWSGSYSGKAFQQWIEEGGGWIRPGAGQKDIYVPPLAEIPGLAPYTTQTGTKIRGKVSNVYHSIARAASGLTSGDITAKEYEATLASAARSLQKEWAPAGKGAGSILRGRALGSRFLRIVSSTGQGAITDPFTVGITKNYFGRMMDEIRQSNLYDEAALKEMEERFYGGGKVGVLGARHPFIGAYSAQPLMAQMVGGRRAEVAVPERLATLTLGGATKEVRLGPLTGWAADKDADIANIMLLGPDAEKGVRKTLESADNSYAQRYLQHQVRMQLFKARKAGTSEGMSISELMRADVTKLGTTQRHIGALSLELNKAKQALVSSGFSDQTQADAQFLLEWLEQTPISAKHLSPKQVQEGALSSIIENMTSAFQTRGMSGAKRLESLVSSVSVSSDMLKNSFQMKIEGEGLRRIAGMGELPGIDVAAATQRIMSAIEQNELSGASRMADITSARNVGITPREIPEAVAAASKKMPQGLMSKVSQSYMAIENFAIRAGRGIGKYKKQIGFGFAGSLALGAILSDPMETIGPAAAMPQIDPSYRRNNQDKVTQTASEQPLGEPSTPNLTRSKKTWIGNNQAMNITVNTNRRFNPRLVASQVGSSNTSIYNQSRNEMSAADRITLGNKLFG